MSGIKKKVTAGFILLDANSKRLKNIEYKVTSINNNKESHVVKGTTNSKGETYEFVKHINTKVNLYVKIGNNEYKNIAYLVLPSVNNKLKIRARVSAVLISSKLKKHGDNSGDIKRKNYKVVKGDTFDSIARKHNTNTAQLKNLNPNVKDIHKIYTGDWLKVPIQLGDVSKETVHISDKFPNYEITSDTYIVQSGDTLGDIAQRSRKSIDELQKINDISNPDKIRKNQVLKLRENTSSEPSLNKVSIENDSPIVSKESWYERAWSSIKDTTDKVEKSVNQGQQKIIDETLDAKEYVIDTSKKLYDTVFSDDTKVFKDNDTKNTSKTESSNSKDKSDDLQLNIKKEVGNNQKGNPTEQVTYDSDTTVYHIYHDGRIERANRQAVGYAKFIYYDESGNKHNLGKSAYKKAQRWIKKNKKDGSKKIYLVDIRDFLTYKKGNVQYKIHKNSEGGKRYYLTGVALAAYLGALCKLSYRDISFNGFSDVNGGPGVSTTHINGEVGDMRYLRKDGRAVAVTVFDSAYSHERSLRLVETLYMFGFGKHRNNYTERYSKPELGLDNYLLPHCEHKKFQTKKGKWVRHHHHLHMQGLQANIKDIDIISKKFIPDTESQKYCSQCLNESFFEAKTSKGIVRISEKLMKAIMNWEGRPKKPYLPGASSGITLGYGYDLGHQTTSSAKKTLSKYFTGTDLQKLLSVVGYTGQKAKKSLDKVKHISISEESALSMFEELIPDYAEQTAKIYPQIVDLHPDCQGSLVSLVYNRGSSLKNRESRKEMINIVAHLKSGSFDEIPNEFVSMKRIWEDKANVRGLLLRRDEEASYFKEGLEKHSNH